MAWLKIGATALLGSMLALAPHAAVAAPGGVQVSSDGVSYGSSYTGSLFGSISQLVPGDTQQGSFFLRNSGTEPGFLRITLRDVQASDADFADALTVSASTTNSAGPAAIITQADPCWVLLEGQLVAPGESVRVTTSLALGDLQGQAGQGATTSLALRVALTSAVTQLPPTSCGSSGTTIPVVPPTGPGVRPGDIGSVPGSAEENVISPVPNKPETDLPVLNLPELLGIDPNTWHLFEEYWVFVPIGAFVLGTAWFVIVARRRRKNEADQEEMDAIG